MILLYSVENGDNMVDLEDKLRAMFCEKTGNDIIDSSIAYGNGYDKYVVNYERQRNLPVLFLQNPGGTPCVRLLPHLANCLTVTEKSEQLEKLLNDNDRQASGDEYIIDMVSQRHIDFVKSSGDYSNVGILENTYNYDTLLETDFQFFLCQHIEDFYKNNDNWLIVLSVHGGCDIRSGYSGYHVFEIQDDNSGHPPLSIIFPKILFDISGSDGDCVDSISSAVSRGCKFNGSSWLKDSKIVRVAVESGGELYTVTEIEKQ